MVGDRRHEDRAGLGAFRRPSRARRREPAGRLHAQIHRAGRGRRVRERRGEGGVDAGRGGTSLAYVAKAQIGGKLAQIGSRLVDGAAAKIADDFFARLAERLGPPPAGAAEAAAEATLEPETAGSGRWVRYAAIAVIVALILWLATRGGIKF